MSQKIKRRPGEEKRQREKYTVGIVCISSVVERGEKRSGRNNIFILCAWLNVFRGPLLDTHGRDTTRRKERWREGGRRQREGKKERETTGLKCILILRVDLHNCFGYVVLFPSEIAAEANPSRYWIPRRNGRDIKDRRTARKRAHRERLARRFCRDWFSFRAGLWRAIVRVITAGLSVAEDSFFFFFRHRIFLIAVSYL